jgi:Na+-driven multidrug efflux pump
MGSALALAGQAAANNAFMTIFYFLNFLPIITAPLGTRLFCSATYKITQP